MVVVILILLLLAITGILGFVLKLAVAIAVGIVLAVVLLASLAAWRIRRTLFGPSSRWRRIPRSRVEVLEPPPRRDF
jgi:heme A synthase